MPDAARPLRASGEPLVTEPDPGTGGAHTMHAPAPTAPPADEPDVGDGLLTSTRVVVAAPRHRIEKRAPILWTIEGIWSWLMLAGL